MSAKDTIIGALAMMAGWTILLEITGALLRVLGCG